MKSTARDPTARDPTIRDPTIRDPTIRDPTIRDATGVRTPARLTAAVHAGWVSAATSRVGGEVTGSGSVARVRSVEVQPVLGIEDKQASLNSRYYNEATQALLTYYALT